jgi:hypothetical protein
MISLTLKEILLYVNIRIRMVLQKNIILLSISSNIIYRKNNKFLNIEIKYKFLKKNYTFNFIEIIKIEKITKSLLELYIDDFILQFEENLI